MSGRVAAIDAVPGDRLTIYAGTAGGGVWKSVDGGLQFKPIFDKYNQSIGAITVDPSKPSTIWVGTGETWARNSVSVGDGIYRSTDGGENWTKLGLDTTERIARIVVHPKDSNTVYACATGHLFDDHPDRGVYRTKDGGKTWNKVLYVAQDVGCANLAIDPQTPDVLYAAMWQVRRKPYLLHLGRPAQRAVPVDRRRRDVATGEEGPSRRGLGPDCDCGGAGQAEHRVRDGRGRQNRPVPVR